MGAPAARTDAWRRETAAYTQGLAALRQSWTSFATSASDLEFKVKQYEDLIQTLTESGGYGNLILASFARKLSDALLIEWAVAHPQENQVARTIMDKSRVHLLQGRAVGEMVTEESGVTAPRGAWHLADREGLEAVLSASASDLSKETGRLIFSGSGPSKLMTMRDLNAVIYLLIGDEVIDQMSLPTLLEYERLGGSPDDLKPWETIMRKQERVYAFPLLGFPGGLTAVGDVAALIQIGKSWQGKQISFGEIVPQ
jgi:hypothetical protein